MCQDDLYFNLWSLLGMHVSHTPPFLKATSWNSEQTPSFHGKYSFMLLILRKAILMASYFKESVEPYFRKAMLMASWFALRLIHVNPFISFF